MCQVLPFAVILFNPLPNSIFIPHLTGNTIKESRTQITCSVSQKVVSGKSGIRAQCASVKVAQSCLTLRPHRLYSPWNSPGQNTGVGSLSLVQGIFPTQGSNPGLPHCGWTLYQLSHREAQEYWSG